MKPAPASHALRARTSPLQGAHPAAWQSQFRGCAGMACSAATGSTAHMAPLSLQRTARRTTES